MSLTTVYQRAVVALVIGLFSIRQALAQVTLPDVGGSIAGNEDDFLGVLQGLASQGLNILLFIVGVAAFVLVGWAVIAKFNECRAGRAEWSEAAVTAGIGAVVLVFSTFLLGQANTFFEGTGGNAQNG